MTDIVERLRDYANDDHERLCQGRTYSCSCGYDDKRDPLMTEAADTITALRAEVEKLNSDIDDASTDLATARQDNASLTEGLKSLRAEVEKLRAALDGAYNERNRLVAFVARLFPSGIKKTDIPGWDEAWHGCVYIDLPTGQASWHFHDREAHLFDGLPPYSGEWDGHSTDEKYERIARAALEEKQ